MSHREEAGVVTTLGKHDRDTQHFPMDGERGWGGEDKKNEKFASNRPEKCPAREWEIWGEGGGGEEGGGGGVVGGEGARISVEVERSSGGSGGRNAGGEERGERSNTHSTNTTTSTLSRFTAIH